MYIPVARCLLTCCDHWLSSGHKNLQHCKCTNPKNPEYPVMFSLGSRYLDGPSRMFWKRHIKMGAVPEVPEFVLEELTGLRPDRANFQKLLKKLGQKEPELIIQVLNSASKRWNLEPDERDYTTGISVCGRQKLWQHACWLLESLSRAQLPLDVFCLQRNDQCLREGWSVGGGSEFIASNEQRKDQSKCHQLQCNNQCL